MNHFVLINLFSLISLISLISLAHRGAYHRHCARASFGSFYPAQDVLSSIFVFHEESFFLMHCAKKQSAKIVEGIKWQCLIYNGSAYF
jgi:hypothetical protein